MKLKYLGTITIGDQYGDGHSKYECFDYTANYSLNDQIDAYHRSVKLTGLHLCFDYDELNENPYKDPNMVCGEVDDCYLSGYHIEILRRYGRFDCSELGDIGPETCCIDATYFAKLVLWFIGLSLDGFKHSPLISSSSKYGNWARIKEDFRAPKHTLNGWKSKLGLFGYGVFSGVHVENSRYKRIPTRSFEDDGTKFHRIVRNNARYYGGNISAFDFELRYASDVFRLIQPRLFTKRLVANGKLFETWCTPEFEAFLQSTRGRIIQAGSRFFFEHETDSLMFKLRFH